MTTKEPPPSPMPLPTFQPAASHDVSILQQVLAGIPQPPAHHDDDEVSDPKEKNRYHQTEEEKDSIVQHDLEGGLPKFTSALSYTTVRDFAYPIFHPLHYGVPDLDHTSGETEEDEDDLDDEEGEEQDLEDNIYGSNGYDYQQNYKNNFEDGPPWQQDDDLISPVIKSHEVGDRISKEYQFSVASADEIHGRAVALFDFTPENDNEAPLQEGQIIWISYRHGQGWLVAEDPETGETGLVPEEYVQLLSSYSSSTEYTDSDILPEPDSSEPTIYQSPESDSEGWIDEEATEDHEAEKNKHEHEQDREAELEQRAVAEEPTGELLNKLTIQSEKEEVEQQ